MSSNSAMREQNRDSRVKAPNQTGKIIMASVESSDHRYRRHAGDCVRVAQQVDDPIDKTLLLQMAEIWRRMAEKAAKGGNR